MRRARRLITWDPTFSRQQLDEAVGRLTGCESYVVAAFASVGAYRGTVGMLGGEMPHALDALIASGKPVALIALGNPYVLRNFANVTAYLATFSTWRPARLRRRVPSWARSIITRHSAGHHPGPGRLRGRNSIARHARHSRHGHPQ